MIRRDGPTPDSFLLITQDDHARLAAQFARRLGNARFAPPAPFEAVIEAIAHHDAGWPLHDDAPTTNAAGQPLHVFEAPVPLATQVWSASVARAMNLGDYQGLLVSLHVFTLSAINIMHHSASPSRPDLFDINKFQHRQIEIQEDLRQRLGLRADVPLQLGLAAPGTSDEDDRLLFNFRYLTFMDRVSLALCCGKNLFPTIDDVRPRPGAAPVPIKLTMPDPATVTIDPWPFDQPDLTFEIPARQVPAMPYGSPDELRATYQAAPPKPLRLGARPLHSA
jgi:hypothetical protein